MSIMIEKMMEKKLETNNCNQAFFRASEKQKTNPGQKANSPNHFVPKISIQKPFFR